MYNLAKLLSEEPEKLERIGILFLKLLVTLFIGSTFFGMNISISGFVENPIPKDYTIAKFISFLIFLVIIWYILWSLIAELIIGEFFIWIASKIGNSKSIFTEILVFLNVIKNDNSRLSPAKNVIAFNHMLYNYTEEDEKILKENKTRLRHYYLVFTVIYFTFLCAKDINLTCWQKWVGGIMSFNFLIASVVFNKIHNYFTENLGEIKKQFGRLAYLQMIINSIEQNQFLKLYYEKENGWSRIHLKRKTENESLPETIKFYHVFYWNKPITQVMLNKGLELRSRKKFSVDKIGKHYDVVICNLEPDDRNAKHILSQSGFAFLYCENEEQIYKNLEVLLFQVTNGIYRID